MSTSDPFLSPPTTGSVSGPFLTSTSTSSRPSSPNRYPSNSYNTLPTPPLSSTNPFQFDPATSTSSGSSRSSSFNHQNNNTTNNNNPYFDSLLPPSGSAPPNMMTRAASSSSDPLQQQQGASGLGSISSQQSAPPIIAYDPNGSPSDFEEDDDDAESGVPGRPRKRKSTRDLRATASNQASAQASSSKSNGAPSGDDDNGDDKGRRKIQIEYIEEKSKRHITFSKRKAGIMKKAYELSTLTGTQVLLLVVSESGWVYTFTTDKFKPLVKEDANGELSQGQKLIAACLEGKESMPNLIPGSYQPSASSTASNFEANSAQHGGQISLKTNQRNRPTATNRRVSSKGRQHIPVAINTGSGLAIDNSLPCPPGSGGIPPVPQLPTPHSGGYLDLASPLSPRDPRSLSHPVSPARTNYGAMQQQQAQAQAQHQQGYSQGQDYAEMMHRAELMQLQNGGYADDQGGYDLNYGLPNSSMASNHNSLHAMHDPHGYSNGGMPQSSHLNQPQSVHNPPPQRTLHHARSQPHMRQHSISNDSASAYEMYGSHPGAPTSHAAGGGGGGNGGGNYTHVRDSSLGSGYAQSGMDPRQNGVNGGYQTPMHSVNNNGGGGGSQASSVHNTPHSHPQQHLPLYSNEDQYSAR
ncbi:hypothetical protein JCM3765_000006 [Sporobolomyces pararoseus]